jgi:hypothetical protein
VNEINTPRNATVQVGRNLPRAGFLGGSGLGESTAIGMSESKGLFMLSKEDLWLSQSGEAHFYQRHEHLT